MKMQSGLHEAPKITFSPALMNLPVDLAQFCEKFQCGMTITRECFAHLGLKNQAFEGQYDEIFGEGEFAKRRAVYSRASLTDNPYRVKDTARKRDYQTYYRREEE